MGDEVREAEGPELCVGFKAKARTWNISFRRREGLRESYQGDDVAVI